MTKSKLFFICFQMLMISLSGQIMWQMDKDSLITWNYQEGDEFNGDSINKNYWSDWYGWGRSITSNKEQQYYSKWKNHFLKDGILTLTAKRQNVTEKFVDHMGDNDSVISDNKFYGFNKRDFTYTAGMIQSLKDFQYGYFEIKFKIPEEKGFWPAFWLYGGRPNEEIDWMELKTEKPDKIHVGRHCQKRADNYIKVFPGKKVGWGDWVQFEGSLTQGYNVIAGEWTPNYLKYYLNGECIAITNVEMNIPKKLVANIAVSSTKGSFPPAPRKDFNDSVAFEIDYIRVWNRNNLIAKRYATKKFKIESVTNPKKISESKLISKSKVHYGKKEIHKNEGLFASFVPQGGFKFQLTVLGKDIPKNSNYTITDRYGKIIVSNKLDYGTTTFDLFKFQSTELTLVIEAFGQKATHQFFVN